MRRKRWEDTVASVGRSGRAIQIDSVTHVGQCQVTWAGCWSLPCSCWSDMTKVSGMGTSTTNMVHGSGLVSL